jgi:peptidoglycan/LPS O-acetylase OafA/YrhL
MHHATRAPGWRPGYRPALDGLRAVAVLLVILNHAGVPGFAHWAGQAGVSIFFVISGYLITGLLVARRERLVTFWRRRALRLLPALGFLLLVITPLSLLLGRHSAWADALVGALYVGNWERALGGGMGDLSHLWSLAIEEQFYLVWPLALLFLRPRARWLVALAVGLALLRPLVTPDMAIFGTFGRADALLLGGAVALSGVRFPSWSAWAGLALVVFIGVLQPDDAAVAAWGLTLASVAGVLLVGGLAQRPGHGSRPPRPAHHRPHLLRPLPVGLRARLALRADPRQPRLRGDGGRLVSVRGAAVPAPEGPPPRSGFSAGERNRHRPGILGRSEPPQWPMRAPGRQFTKERA